MSTQYDTTSHAALLSAMVGRHYNDVRAEIERLDWDGLYPIVDHDGNLTGEMAGIDSTGYDICDVTDDGLRIHDHAADAMVEAR